MSKPHICQCAHSKNTHGGWSIFPPQVFHEDTRCVYPGCPCKEYVQVETRQTKRGWHVKKKQKEQ